ncbi:MAG: TadE/TadG family type IV pilus assembly protein [Beijerinckiaceae bacterium]
MLRRAAMPDSLPRVLGAFFGWRRLAIAGVAAIELALVSPVLITGVLGAGELGITILRKTQVQFAAQAGINYAIAHGFDAAKISAAIVNATNYKAIFANPAPSQSCGCATPTGVVATACGSTCPGGGFKAGTYVQVNSRAQFCPIIPNPWQQSTVILTAQATVRTQ